MCIRDRSNPDIKILFVDTFERFATAQENLDKVKEFLTQNNYPFQVLMDSQSKTDVYKRQMLIYVC